MLKKFNCPHCKTEHEIFISFDQFMLTRCSKCGEYILKALLMKEIEKWEP
jgi:transcription elongation factor Elf1